MDNVFIETTDTMRCKIFLELSYLANQNVLIFGAVGSGKTMLLQNYVQNFGEFPEILRFFSSFPLAVLQSNSNLDSAVPYNSVNNNRCK
jgi:hypothetical protein